MRCVGFLGCYVLLWQLYPSQTNIWEGWTKEEIRICEALFKGVSTRFGLRTIEKCFANPDFIFCSSFPNLRLGGIDFARWLQKIVACYDALWCVGFSGMLRSFVSTLFSPNEDFGSPNEHLGTHFRSTFQRVSTRFGLRSFEITSKMHSQMFVRTSKIFVWGE